MTRLTDEQLAELEKRLTRHEATQHPHEEHTEAALEYHDALFEHGANLIRELRELRKVRDAAKTGTIADLFAALDEAGGEK